MANPVLKNQINFLQLIYSQLNTFAKLDNFLDLFDTAFGSDYDYKAVVKLRSQWQKSDFSQLPEIEVISSSILGNANGAYAKSNNKIYLSDNFVATALSISLQALLLEEIGHYVDGLGLVSRVDNSQVDYYDADAIGSIIGLTGADGEYVNRYQYLPFGEDLSKTETVSNPFEYVGQWGVMDEGNGLDFMRSRFYDKVIGKFSSIDPIGLALGDSNFYSYASNTPLNQIDPDGNTPLIVAGTALGALAGMSTYVVGTVLSGKKTTLGGFAGSAVSGAITGGVLGATGGLGLSGSAVLGATSSAIGYRIEKAIDKQPIDLIDFSSTTILGALPLGKAKVSKPTTWGLGSPEFKNTFLKNNKHGKFLWDDLTRSGIGNNIGSSLYNKINDLAIPPNSPPKSSDFPIPDPSTSISINNATVNENNGNLTFTVSIQGNHTQPITVNYTTVNGSAISGQDYQAVSGTLTFASGQNVKTIAVPIIDDNQVESLEKLQVVLSNATGATISNRTGVGAIVDNDKLPQINITNTTAAEGDSAQFTVTLSEASTSPITVNYTTANGSAIASQDYQGKSGTLTFAPNEKTKTIDVATIKDDQNEGLENFQVTLGNANGAEISNGTGKGTISDDPQQLLLSIDNVTVKENEGIATFTVKLSKASNSPVSVSFNTNNGSAIAGQDYTLSTGILIFNPSDTEKTIDVSISDDKQQEETEHFTVTLFDANGAEIANDIGDGAISDNDQLPHLTISGGGGGESSGSGSFTVTLSKASDVEVKVNYSAINGTAILGSDFDFTSANHTLTFAPGTTSLAIPITIYDDETDEDTETFSINLSNPQNEAIATGTAQGTIGDNDPNKKTEQPQPKDPNDIVGPASYGDRNWVNATQTLPYTIRFENKAEAQAPAHTVTITHPLDSDLDWRTFRVGSFGWGDITITPPNSQPFYATRIDLTSTKGYYIDVSAGLNTQTGEAFWTFTTIDPQTGESPTDPFLGFLPPTDENGSGQGFVNYSIRPKQTSTTGDIIDAKATIIFDTEEPIDTPAIFNTIDAGKPTSSVVALPPTTQNSSFQVSWSGVDDQTGSGLARYSVYVAINNGNYTPWLTNTNLTEATYTGTPGHTYAFYTVASDNAGNTQTIPTIAQATTQIINSNQIPVLAVNQGLTLDEQTTATLTNTKLQVTDADNTAEQITYTLTDLPDNGSLLLNGTILALNGTFTQGDINNNKLSYTHNGSETTSDSFSFTISDGKGGQIANTLFNITVNPVDDAPVVKNAIADQTTKQGDAFNFQIPTNTFTDIDAGDVLTYSATLENGNTLPSWLTFNSTTRTFSGTPTNDNVGSLNVNAIATDKAGASVSDIFAIAVENLNDAPIVTSGSSINFAENGTGLAYTVIGTDPDTGTILAYSISGTDANRFNINSNTGAVTFKTAPNFEAPTDNGANNIFDINVIASDGSLNDTKALTISVTNVNEAPIVNSAIASQAINNGSAFNYSFASNTFADPEGTTLTYSITGNPTWLSFDSTTRTFSGTANGVGTSTITVSASDGTNVTKTNFALVVNTPIVAASSNDQRSATSGQTIINTSANDSIFGSAFNDVIKAGDGNHTIYGGDGNDRLYGGTGNDILVGGNGIDNLYAGSGTGSDTFVIQPSPFGLDIVNGFQDGRDFIGLSAANSGSLTFGSLSFSSYGVNGLSTSIKSGGVELMRLINVAPTLITAADFHTIT